MRRDAFGICLSKDMLCEHLHSTFTHVRAYEIEPETHDEMRVLFAFPQMSGKDVLTTMQGTKKLVWRADYYCPPTLIFDHFPTFKRRFWASKPITQTTGLLLQVSFLYCGP